MHKHTTAGITIVEVIIGVAIVGLVVVFVSQTLALFFQASETTLARTQALYLLEEGKEIMRYLRDSDWNHIETNLSNGTTYYLDITPTTLNTTTAPEVIDGTFERSFVLSAVERDGNDDIVASGTTDPGSRLITFTVAWGSESLTATSLITNLYDI